MTEEISNAGKITRAFDFLMLNFTSKDVSEEKIDFYSQKLIEEFE